MRGMTMPPGWAAGEILAAVPRRAWARFRRLRRAKQALLLLLALLDVILASATALYAWQPATPAAHPPPRAAAHGTALAASDGASIAGDFLADQGQALLVLRQYDGAVTGTLTQLTCSHGRAQRTEGIITGQVQANNFLRLTYSAPTLAHSTTVAYALAPSATGFVLTWHDAHGLLHRQVWTRGTASSLLTHCPVALAKQSGG